jgi:hypothetical protein
VVSCSSRGVDTATVYKAGADKSTGYDYDQTATGKQNVEKGDLFSAEDWDGLGGASGTMRRCFLLEPWGRGLVGARGGGTLNHLEYNAHQSSLAQEGDFGVYSDCEAQHCFYEGRA